ncbi:MAG: hypothetical protein MUF27_09140 [Acidobacteria bacterium]|nr:hypothetical protein [Acidobacteriota bacterium]
MNPRARNATKAEVTFEERAGRAVVVKDYGSRPWWVRVFYGRPTLRREARVYARLAGVPGVPASLGLETPDRLVLARAPGLPSHEVLKGSYDARAVCDALDTIVAAIHARGVAIGDLHRRNVLIAPPATVHVIDFAIARIAHDPARPGWLVRRLQDLDRHAAARLRARMLGLPEPEPPGSIGAFYRAGRRLKRVVSGR